MRVVFAAAHGVLGGAERTLLATVGVLAAGGVDVRVVVAEAGPLVDALGPLVDGVGWDSLATALHGSDIAVGWADHGTIALAPRAHQAGVPLVWWRTLTWRGRPYEHEAAAAGADLVVVCTRMAAATQRKVTPTIPVAVVPPGLAIHQIRSRRDEGYPVREAMGWTEEVQVVGMVARLDPAKGQDLFVDSLGLLHRSRPTIRGLVVGGDLLGFDGDLAADLAVRIRDRGLEDVVQHVQHVDDPIPWQAALDVAVNASRHEAFGLSILEAMALGVPVVATPTDGAHTLLDGGRAGVLSPPSPPALAASVLTLLDDPSERERIRALGQQRAGTFDLASLGVRARRVLESVCR